MHLFFSNAVSTVTTQYHLLFVIWWCKTPTFSCWCQNNKRKLRNPGMHCYILLNIDMKIDITHNFVEYNPLILWQRNFTDRHIAWSSKLLYTPSAMSFNKDVCTGNGRSTRYIPIIPFPRLVLRNMITEILAVPNNPRQKEEKLFHPVPNSHWSAPSPQSYQTYFTKFLCRSNFKFFLCK